MAGGVLTLVTIGLSWLVPYPQNQYFPFVYSPAALALLVALICLGAVQGRRRPVLTWSAVAVPVAALVVSLVGMAGMFVRGDRPLIAGLSSWYLWSFGLLGLIIGSVLFATATAIVGVFSRSAALALLAGSTLLVVSIVFGMLGLFDSQTMAALATIITVVPIIGLLLFAGGWIWLGYAAATRRAVDLGAAAV